MNEKPVIVVSETIAQDFESRCEELVLKGYRMVSSDCGVVQSAEYDYPDYYIAIFVAQYVTIG